MLSPSELARRLRGLGGLVWLDSASAAMGQGMKSLVAAAPVEMLRGNIWREWQAIEDTLVRFAGQPGALMGYVGYDGEFTFGRYDHWLMYDHDCELWCEEGASSLMPTVVQQGALSSRGTLEDLHFQPTMTREGFIAAVERAQAYISAGDIYQVNLACKWSADCSADCDAMVLYEKLRSVSPAPHAAFMELGVESVLSSSPECFLRIQDRCVVTRPIKGTRPRFPDDARRDENSAHELAHSPKERAELLMITDLERNDLGMVAEYGSVRVPELATVERYAQVFHLVSTVTATLRSGVNHAEVFKACFPGGSITGAPKRRAREIIAELEPISRGIYTGAIGYFGFDGSSDFNIAIRTAVHRPGQVSFHVGSGIVADSVPSLEWEETLHKAGGLLKMGRA